MNNPERMVIAGRVVAVFQIENPFSPWLESWQMIVMEADGSKLVGTVPRCMMNISNGDLVQFEAERRPPWRKDRLSGQSIPRFHNPRKAKRLVCEPALLNENRVEPAL